MKKGGRKSPVARVDPCFIRISPGLKDPEGKSRSLKTESIQTMVREYGNDVTHRPEN